MRIALAVVAVVLLSACGAGAQVTDFGPHSGIGPCPANQAVIRLNANGPPTCGATGSIKTYTFATLPGTCTANQDIAICSDCKNVADGVTASSQAIGNGHGAILRCAASNIWDIAP